MVFNLELHETRRARDFTWSRLGLEIMKICGIVSISSRPRLSLVSNSRLFQTQKYISRKRQKKINFLRMKKLCVSTGTQTLHRKGQIIVSKKAGIDFQRSFAVRRKLRFCIDCNINFNKKLFKNFFKNPKMRKNVRPSQMYYQPCKKIENIWFSRFLDNLIILTYYSKPNVLKIIFKIVIKFLRLQVLCELGAPALKIFQLF